MPSIDLFPGVLSLILTRSVRAGRIEIGGFLIGKQQERRLQVTGATFPRQVGSSTHVSINDIDMALLAEDLAKRGTGEVIVGWWHTHPGMGAHFMSGTDIATQQRYQAFFPSAIAMVVDPLKFSKSLELTDLDLHIYTIKEGYSKDLDYVYAKDPSEIIPDLYLLLQTLEAAPHLVYEDTWFERMIRDVFGKRITTPEFSQTLGRFLEATVAFSVISITLLLVILSLIALIG